MWNIKIFSIKSMPLGKLNLFKYISNKNKYVTLKKIKKERKLQITKPQNPVDTIIFCSEI